MIFKQFPSGLVLSLMLSMQVLGLTGSQVSQACHCDLTSAFCDFDCCCDLDCSSSVSSQCFNAKSAQFCLDTTFYFKINTMKSLVPTGEQDCYYYNTTTQLQEEVALADWQLKYLATQLQSREPIGSSVSQMYEGYTGNTPFTIGGSSQLHLVDSSGNCIANGATNTYTSSIKFGSNFDITCLSTSNSINLFTSILGKEFSQYYLDTSSSNMLTIPTASEPYTAVTINFLIAKYGSQNAKYVQQVRISSSNASGSTRTLRIRFIDPEVSFDSEIASPSFFPQIPFDIFYPIHQIAFSF